MNEKKQVNEGYTIIESMTVGSARFVIGENLHNPVAPYVTWQANIRNDPDNSGGTTARLNWAQSQILAGASLKKPKFSVIERNPRQCRYQSEVRNDEQT